MIEARAQAEGRAHRCCCMPARRHPAGAGYRSSQLFRTLRGECGHCEFQELCARAHALTGGCLAEDPSCVYEPIA